MNIVRIIAIGIALSAYQAAAEDKDQGAVEQIGKRVDQAMERAGEEARGVATAIQEGFEQIRDRVDRMGVSSRVYARLHWDKALDGASITVEVDPNRAAVLRGTVPTESAKSKADQLAADTMGVDRVDNQLKVDQPATAKAPAKRNQVR